MTANIISIGNELLIGDTINTNASWIGEFLTELGFRVSRIYTISDDLDEIKHAISDSLSYADLTICTGGLGPTHDDITKVAALELFESELILDQRTLDYIKDIFEKRNIPFSASNFDQAKVPDVCEVLFNKAGTAPGMWFNRNEKYLAMLPGVPYEMKYLMQKEVIIKIRNVFGDIGFINSKYIKTAGVGESTLADNYIGDVSMILNENVKLAYLPKAGSVTLRLNSKGNSREEANHNMQQLVDHIYNKAGDYIYGEGRDLSLEEALGNLLSSKKYTVSTAESCTGGLIANLLTDVPGSSKYVLGGIIAYSNEVKEIELGVLADDLNSVGAVSKEVALQMAKGVAKKLGTDIGISTTGIAGPDGGTEDKPVGTVWMGFYSDEWHFAIKALFTKDRLMNKTRTAVVSLETLRRSLLGIEVMPYDLEKQTV